MLDRSALGPALVLLAACGTGGGTRDGGGDATHPGDGAMCAATDEPDPMGLDSNCDGVDGELARGVFVAPSGDDAAPGTPARPVRTLAHAIDLASAAMNHYVLVAAGAYAEALTVRAGVSVYGGYDPAFRTRTLGTTRIAPATGSALIADGVSAARTVVSGFAFVSADATAPGASSIAGRVRAASMLELSDDSFEAGAGAAGASGMPGTAGTAGMPGETGTRGVPCRAAGGPCASPYMYPAESPPLPGRGGRGCMLGSMGGVDYYATGGTGGAAGYPGYYPPASPHTQGANGGGGVCAPLSCTSSTRGGSGGATTIEPTAPTPGMRGADGAPGDDGMLGMPGGPGTFAFDGFAPAGGGDGTNGVPGSGGGGGGGGGGYLEAPRLPSELLYFGAAGSGGGGGGCGGTAGHGGGGGGASVGLIVAMAAPTMVRVAIHTSGGGAGGAGGMGGVGGAGGTGGPAMTAWVAGGVARGGAGGPGGTGGAGGAGGAGGGGAGGPSVGVVLLGGAVMGEGDTRFEIGTPGPGAGGATPGVRSNIATF